MPEPPAEEVLRVMGWCERYREQLEERYRRLEDLLREIPDRPEDGRPSHLPPRPRGDRS